MKRSSLRDAVLPMLRQDILAGILEPGTRLSEVEIARKLGVSRSPVREAIAHLEQEGLVERHPNRGAFVIEILSSRAIGELAGLRNTLETYAVQMLGKPVADEDLESLFSLTVAMDEAAQARAWDAIADADYRFHHGLVTLADHAKLLHTWVGIADQYWALYLPHIQRLGRDIDNWGRNHRQILRSLIEGRPDLAIMYLQYNILNSSDQLAEIVGERGVSLRDGVDPNLR